MAKANYSVYEIRADGRSFIGSVEATSDRKANEKARRKFGAPIDVQAE